MVRCCTRGGTAGAADSRGLAGGIGPVMGGGSSQGFVAEGAGDGHAAVGGFAGGGVILGRPRGGTADTAGGRCLAGGFRPTVRSVIAVGLTADSTHSQGTAGGLPAGVLCFHSNRFRIREAAFCTAGGLCAFLCTGGVREIHFFKRMAA